MMNREAELAALDARLAALPVGKSKKPNGNAVNKIVDAAIDGIPYEGNESFLDSVFTLVRKYRR